MYSDVCGPINLVSLGGSRYFLTFTDDHSGKTCVYMLEEKIEEREREREREREIDRSGRAVASDLQQESKSQLIALITQLQTRASRTDVLFLVAYC
ncbi:unnamed protein product [Musa acuminata subsp. malaccensis]|uniref:(wild Malaysian banana) hypothetical protein n=1 Tax=Musa acuminata subsp. malaccensis TaxID=214687 RepID=A0A8D6ZZ45_MUSAM|nr:unnamed protein product [Musa acuminata subsp. malaccensis]